MTIAAPGRNSAIEIATSPVPGRQVDKQIVRLVPVNVREELLQGLVQHRPAPHDRVVLGREEPDRDDLHAEHLGRHDHVADDRRSLVDAEHPRDREPPNVRVEQPDAMPELRQGRGEVHGRRGLAHAALARADRDDLGRRVGALERGGRLLRMPPIRA